MVIVNHCLRDLNVPCADNWFCDKILLLQPCWLSLNYFETYVSVDNWWMYKVILSGKDLIDFLPSLLWET